MGKAARIASLESDVRHLMNRIADLETFIHASPADQALLLERDRVAREFSADLKRTLDRCMFFGAIPAPEFAQVDPGGLTPPGVPIDLTGKFRGVSMSAEFHPVDRSRAPQEPSNGLS